MLHRLAASSRRFPALLVFACALALGAHPATAQPVTVDGTLVNGLNNSEPYVTAAPRASGVGNDTAPEAERILFYADDDTDTLYVGVRGALPTNNKDGIALWLNFQELDGAAAGTDLSVPGAPHYMNNSFKADFEVDYTISMTSNTTNSEVQAGVVKHVGTTASQNLGTTDQSGSTITVDFFSSGSDVTWGFDNSGTGNDQGFEIAIPYSALGVDHPGAMEAFAGIVSSGGYFYSETVPGDLGGVDPGTNPDFSALGGGPFHRTKTFTARFTDVGFDNSDGSFTKNNTWEATETDGETIPFQGSKVIAGSEAGGNNSHVLFDTNVTLHTFTVDTATDGDGSNFSEVGSGNTLTITDSLTLKSETFADGGGTLDMTDGTTVERSGGTIDFTPTYGGSATLLYTTGATTGPELPTSAGGISLRVDASGTVTLQGGTTPTLGGNLTIQSGTFDDNGNTFTISGNATVASGATHTGGGTLLFSSGSGTHTLAGSGTYGTVELNESSDFSGAPEATISEGASFASLIATEGVLEVQAGGGPVSGAVTVDSELQLADGLDVGGDLTVNGTVTHNGHPITLNGSTAQTLGGTTSPVTLDILALNNGSGATLETDLSIADTLALTNGPLSRAGSEAVTMDDGSTVHVESGTMSFSPTVPGGTAADVVYTEANVTTGAELPSAAPGAVSLHVKNIGGANTDGTMTLQSGANPTLGGDLTIEGQSILDANDGTITVNGDATIESQSDFGIFNSPDEITTATLVFRGGSSTHIVKGGGFFAHMKIDQTDVTGPEVSIEERVIMNALTVTQGVLDVGQNVSLDALDPGPVTVESGGELVLAGRLEVREDLTLNGPLTPAGGNVFFKGADNTLKGSNTPYTLPDLSIGFAVAQPDENDLTLQGPVTVAGGLTFHGDLSSTFDLNENDVVVKGNLDLQLANSDSVKTDNTTITLDGAGDQFINNSDRIDFHNLVVSGGDIEFFGFPHKIENRFTIKQSANVTKEGGGFSPQYGSNSLLRYEAGGPIERGAEWDSTGSDEQNVLRGHPQDVEITGGTTLDLSAGGAATARSIAGALTIGANSTLDMDDMSAALTVPGALTVDGTLALGSAAGGNAEVQGSTVQIGGTVNTNSGRFILNGSSAQTLTGGGTIGALTINNANGVSLEDNLTVGSELRLTSGTLSRSTTETLTLGDGSTVRRSNGTLGFTPSFGTPVNVTYTAGLTTGNELSPSNAGTLTVDASGGTVILAASTDPTLQGDLTIQNGTFDDNGNTITVNGGATVTGTGHTWNGALVFSGGSSTHTLAGSGAYGPVELNESSDFSSAPEATISEGASFASLTATTGALEVQAGGATVSGAVTIDSDLQLSGGLDVGGDLSVNGSLTANGNPVTLNGSNTQTIGGTVSSLSLGGLTLDNSEGAELGMDLSIAGTLALTSGTLSRTGSQTLTMQDGSTLRVGTGSIGFAPTYNGSAGLIYTAGTTTGSELTAMSLNTLEVDATGETVMMEAGANPTVGGALTVTNGTLDLNGNDVTLKGNLTSNGTLSAGSSALTFSGSGTQTISGGPTLNDLTTTTTVDPGSGTTVNGTLSFEPGGSLTNNAPTYGGSATLRYATGTATDRGVEWSSTSGAGYPTDVTLANGTTLDLSAGDAGTARSIDGALTIGGSSTLTMDDMSAALTVGNGATVNGTLTLGSAAGGDLIVSGGDLTVDGTLTANGRTVTLSGRSAQTFGGTVSSLSLGGLTVDNSNDVTLGTGITLSKLLTLTNGTLTSNGNLTLQSTASRTAAVAGAGSGTVSGDVTMERHVDFSDDGTNNSHWRFLSSPLSVLLDDAGAAGNSDNLLSNVWTQSTGSGANVQVSADNATLFTYAEDTNVSSGLAEGWTDVADLNASAITPGDGHLSFLFENNRSAGPDGFPVTLSVTGSLPANETDGTDAAPALTFTDDDDPDSQNGWNLVANPFAAPLDWESVVDNGLAQLDKTIYVWDPDAGQYATYTADGGGAGGAGSQDQYIAPFQAFFVKAGPLSIKPPDPPTKSSSLDPGMTILAGDKAVGENPSLKSAPPDSVPPRITLRLRTASDSTGETTVVRYTDEAYAGKDRLDAYQLKPFRADYALVASGMQGRDALFDLQSRPVPAVRDTLDLALDVTASGTYTLDAAALQGLPPGWKVILEHKETGARHDLGAGASVTFDYTAPASGASSSPVTASPLRNGHPTVATSSDSSDALPDYRLYVGPQAALPVELASFDATTDARAVSLTWRTASETNNAGFTVERRVEGSGSWVEVGTREGAGTTTQPQTYRFRDTEVPFAAETLTYRLRQADLDGTATHSDPRTVSLAAPETTTLRPPFPNPGQHRATIRYTLPRAQEVTIALYDVLGRRVRTLAQGQRAAGRYEQAVDLSGLSSGAYFVRLRSRNATRTERLTVAR